jgi:uncharacterized protein (DUF302 family)
MTSINMKQTVAGALPEVLERVTAAIQKEGFGVLTRIDLHQKFKEKLGKEVPPVIILGACNPQLAYEAYAVDSDVAALLPCNVVLRELSPRQISVEIARPSAMMAFLNSAQLVTMAEQADARLLHALKTLVS